VIKRLVGNIIVLGIAVWIGLFVYGFIHAAWEGSRNLPGKKEFEQANTQIVVYSKQVAFGNSDKATALASEFSDGLAGMSSGVFTGGSTITPATNGHFLTYCRLDDSSVVFLCQVPDLRGYKDSVRGLLAKLAWAAASATTGKMIPGKNLKLAVGLRGFGSYGPVMEGAVNGIPKKLSMDDPDAVERLYPYFIQK
jgi:hypothetical protein